VLTNLPSSQSRRAPSNPAEQVLRRVARYQQQHPWLGVPFAVVRKFGDDRGGNLTTLPLAPEVDAGLSPGRDRLRRLCS
jgi:hypothetical protein